MMRAWDDIFVTSCQAKCACLLLSCLLHSVALHSIGRMLYVPQQHLLWQDADGVYAGQISATIRCILAWLDSDMHILHACAHSSIFTK